MIEKGVLLKLLDHKKFAILKLLYFSKEELYLREIAKKSKVSVSSVFRIIQELMETGLVRMKGIKMMKFYSLVRNEKTRFLDDWFKEETMVDVFVELAKNVEGVKKILLYGKVKENQGNVIVLGPGIDEAKIDAICNKIKEKGFDLSNVVFTESQFEKLDKMGVYGGEKKVLL